MKNHPRLGGQRLVVIAAVIVVATFIYKVLDLEIIWDSPTEVAKKMHIAGVLEDELKNYAQKVVDYSDKKGSSNRISKVDCLPNSRLSRIFFEIFGEKVNYCYRVPFENGDAVMVCVKHRRSQQLYIMVLIPNSFSDKSLGNYLSGYRERVAYGAGIEILLH